MSVAEEMFFSMVLPCEFFFFWSMTFRAEITLWSLTSEVVSGEKFYFDGTSRMSFFDISCSLLNDRVQNRETRWNNEKIYEVTQCLLRSNLFYCFSSVKRPVDEIRSLNWILTLVPFDCGTISKTFRRFLSNKTVLFIYPCSGLATRPKWWRES